ncbi:hypothetical protein PV11_06539 [Exophiala sideris]|uniref:Uncharacterized protein n=1 Tax=Exophiala sideris TaxID=1016849 RepID=A0A0D1WUR8_9EURO|nr:hypothetical protein PV11_06539 [Exophiala sideris]
MKATITQRFLLDGCEVDAESDCRFLFFWENNRDEKSGDSAWEAEHVRHWYEKDKLIAVDPRHIPSIDDEHLQRFPSGYRYLAYCQEKTMGVKVLKDMPGHNRERGIEGGSKIAAEKHDLLYQQAKQWLEGTEINF